MQSADSFSCENSKNSYRFSFFRYVCDRQKDCSDGEDEINCTITTPPPLCDGFRCLNSNQCQKKTYLCDNHKDCWYGEDELCCSKEKYLCPSPPGSKYLGKCIKRRMLCDSYTDCQGGFDEMNCNTSTTTTVSTTIAMDAFQIGKMKATTSNKC